MPGKDGSDVRHVTHGGVIRARLRRGLIRVPREKCPVDIIHVNGGLQQQRKLGIGSRPATPVTVLIVDQNNVRQLFLKSSTRPARSRAT